MLHHPINLDLEYATESKAYDSNHYKIMTKDFLSIRKDDLEWLARKYVPFETAMTEELLRQPYTGKRSLCGLKVAEKKTFTKTNFPWRNCKRGVKEGNRSFVSGSEKRVGYARLYSKKMLEDRRFKVSNELWKKRNFSFQRSSLLRNLAGDKFYVSC